MKRASQEVVMCVSTTETDDLLDEGEDRVRRTLRVGGGGSGGDGGGGGEG